MNKVLVVAVHPDDETLGCGGTLLKHKDNGDQIFWLIVTSVSEEQGFDKKVVERRDREIEEVKAQYRFDEVYSLNYPTMHLDEIPLFDLITSIGQVVDKVKPNIIYLPFKNDIHSDHRIAFQAAYSCTKPFRYPFIKRIMMMETLSETEFVPAIKEDYFVPNSFVDISGFIDRKIEIMNIYGSEIGKHPFPRSKKNIEALANFRGAMSGCSYAESFTLLKEIV
jgi:LmbE family N-acetylglucosaminyl deacetylase